MENAPYPDAQSVVAPAQIQSARPLAQREGCVDVAALELVGVLLHEGIGILREATRGGGQQAI